MEQDLIKIVDFKDKREFYKVLTGLMMIIVFSIS